MASRRFTRRLSWCAGLTFALSMLASRTASAEPTAEERAQAESLFNEAKALIDKGELPPACDRFEKSQRLDPQIGTLLYLATCHEQIGQTATAWGEFKEALELATAAKKFDRIAQAKDGVARVEPTLSKATVIVEEAAPGQIVRINGREVKVLETALPYNPGALSVEAEAPGRAKHTQTVDLVKGPTEITITIPKLAVEGPKVAPEEKGRDHTLAFIVGGAGVGVTAVGLALGGAAWAVSGSADEHCEGTFCTQEGLDGHETADALAWSSNILVPAGLLGVGAGVVLFFVWPPDSTKEDAAPSTTGMPFIDVAPGMVHVGWKGVLP
jgi:hypothetical protein